MNVRTVRMLIYLAVLVAVGLVVKACATSEPTVEPTKVAVVPPTTTPEPPLPTAVPPTDTPPPTETAVPPSPTPAPPTDTPPPTETVALASPTAIPPEDTATPEPEVDLASATSENCVGCHTSQEVLQALAEDKTVQSEATSGEG
jgi:hypothetical protein